jgi:hypothetical protein
MDKSDDIILRNGYCYLVQRIERDDHDHSDRNGHSTTSIFRSSGATAHSKKPIDAPRRKPEDCRKKVVSQVEGGGDPNSIKMRQGVLIPVGFRCVSMVLREWSFLSKKSSAKRSFMTTRKRMISMAMTLIETRRVMKQCMGESKLLCNHQLLQFLLEL